VTSSVFDSAAYEICGRSNEGGISLDTTAFLAREKHGPEARVPEPG
jgi:hypothetical protein